MANPFRKKLWHLFFCTSISLQLHADISSLARNDAYPVFSAQDPQTYLLTCEKLELKNTESACDRGCHVFFSVSPFAQNANNGKTLDGAPFIDPNTATDTTIFYAELGDLAGKTNMLALLFGTVPNGLELAPALQDAKRCIFNNVDIINFEQCGALDLTEFLDSPTCAVPDSNNEFIDRNQEFGFFSFPLKYHKRGVRFDFQARFQDCGVHFQTGACSIRQLLVKAVNETPANSKFPTTVPDCGESGSSPLLTQIDSNNVDAFLMEKLNIIAEEIGINIGDFVQTSMEEFRASFFWRHLYELNRCRDRNEWAYAFVIPFFQITGSFSPGKGKNPRKLFAAPFGNDKYTAVGISAGVDIDFIETIEIGGEFGYTHFFQRTFFDHPMPTSLYQTNIFPFATDVKIQPGANWHFTGKISAYHFIDMLSFYFQYVVVEHKKDQISLLNPERDYGVFLPEVLEEVTSFKMKAANIGFEYDISPNLAIGFFWQAPLSQRNSYRSTTILFSFEGTF